MDPLTLCVYQARAFWLLLGLGCSLALLTVQLFRRKNYLSALLERERLSSAQKLNAQVNSSSKRYSELQRSLLESFLLEPTPTLNDLVGRIEREFQARASEESSDETIQLTTRDLMRR